MEKPIDVKAAKALQAAYDYLQIHMLAEPSAEAMDAAFDYLCNRLDRVPTDPDNLIMLSNLLDMFYYANYPEE